MRQRCINATLTIAALALTAFLIITVLPRAGTAAPRLERQPLESLTALNSTEATERGAPLSAFSVSSAASVVQSPGTTTHISAPPTTMCTSKLIWQIGTLEGNVTPGTGCDEFESGAEFHDVYDYNVDTNPDDEIDAPNFPGVLDDELRSRSVWTAREININFDLNILYNDVFLAYSRYGSEIDDILLDGSLITSIVGPGEDVHQSFSIALGTLTPGVHTITIRYAGGGVDRGHSIDALSLRGSVTIPITAIWQIGTFDGAVAPETGADEFEAGTAFYDIYNYDVDTNSDDEINAPNFPGLLYDALHSNPAWTAREITIDFNLDHLYNDVFLAYSRYGSETNDILLGGSLITSTIGPGEGVHQLFSIALGTLAPGVHTVTIRYAGGGIDEGNYIDALGLCGPGSGPPTPFLDLPFEYTNFAEAAFGRIGDQGPGRVRSWFDHTYPDYGGNPDGRNIFTIYTGYTDTTNINLRTCDTGVSCYDGHNGLDFSPHTKSVTETIRASAGGVVTDTVTACNDDCRYGGCPECGAYGNYVLIDHENDYATRYTHLASVSVTETTRVNSRDTLGIMGSTGNSTGVHLHFSVYYDDDGDGTWEEDEVVDPYGWLGSTDEPWEASGGPATDHWLWTHEVYIRPLVLSDQGATITDTTGHIEVTIPPNAFSGQATFELSPGPVAGSSAQLRSIGRSFWLRLLEWLPGGGSLQSATTLQSTTQLTLTKPITLTVTYTDTDVLHLDVTQLALHRWDEEQETWQPLTTTVDSDNHVVTAQTEDLGDFDLQAPLLCATDDLEPDDGYAAARWVWPNDWPVARSLDIPQDSDWSRFDAVKGVTYTISAQNLAAGADTVLNLYDVDALTLLDSNDDAGGGPASELVWTAPYTGTFFVETVSAPGGTTDCSATYELTIATIPGDVIANCRVDIGDIMAVASHWRLSAANPDPDNDPITPNYETRFDLDRDGDIDVVDIMLVVVHWGETCG